MNTKIDLLTFQNYIKKCTSIIFLISLLYSASFESIAQTQELKISIIKPLSGEIGASVTIGGTGFNSKCKVYFGTIPAKILSSTAIKLFVEVPAGATYDRITVINPDIASDQSDFFFSVSTPSPCAFKTPLFDAVQIFPINLNISNIALADINGDGLEDLLVLESKSNLYIYLNKSKSGTVTFEESSSIRLNGKNPTNIAVSDLNNDGYMDAVIGYSTGNQISILPGSSNGGFEEKIENITVNISPSLSPKYVCTGDLNNDGTVEIIVGNVKDKTVSILSKTPTRFSIFNYTSTTPINDVYVTDLAVGDIDGDGFKDIVTTDGNKGYYYSATSEYKTSNVISTNPTNLISLRDFDLNGKADLVFGTQGSISSYNTNIFKNYKNKLYTDIYSSAITSSDFNSDGNPDIAALVSDGKYNHITFFENDGSGGFNFKNTDISTDIIGSTNLLSGDIDKDGQADLITFNPTEGGIYVYLKSSTVSIYKSSVTSSSQCQLTAATVTAVANEGVVSWYSDVKLQFKIASGNSAVIPANFVLPRTKIYYQAISGNCNSSVAALPISVIPPPTFSPPTLLTTVIGQAYNAGPFTVTGGRNPTFNISPKTPSNFTPPGLSLITNAKGETYYSGTPTSPGTYYFTMTSTENLKCPGSNDYQLVVNDLLEPNLIVFPIYKNVGDAAFFIRPNTLSNGAITYRMVDANGSTITDPCVSVGPNGYVQKINCVPTTASQILLEVTQAATVKYKSKTIKTTLYVSPNPETKVFIATSGIILADGPTTIKYATNSDAAKSTIQITQLTNPTIATVNTDGTIIPLKEGSVDIEIFIPATTSYATLTKIFTISIYPILQKPIIKNDTVVISVNQDTILNILENDFGITSPINASQTDIDIENNGVQNKYFSISIGNFLMDLNGNLQVKPFSGFLGEGKIGYTITDSSGLKSDIGYVYIKVIPLLVTPPLKANELMTPNNDGYNDGLVIAYAHLDKNNSLKILDEVGNVVYETTNYQNDWRGLDSNGKPVEAGVYFYVYDEKVSGRGLKQYIQVVK